MLCPAVAIASLMAEPETCFADQKAWLAHLDGLGFTTLDVTPNPVQIATREHCGAAFSRPQILCDAVVLLSDDAGQFNVGQHALCWVRGTTGVR